MTHVITHVTNSISLNPDRDNFFAHWEAISYVTYGGVNVPRPKFFAVNPRNLKKQKNSFLEMVRLHRTEIEHHCLTNCEIQALIEAKSYNGVQRYKKINSTKRQKFCPTYRINCLQKQLENWSVYRLTDNF